MEQSKIIDTLETYQRAVRGEVKETRELAPKRVGDQEGGDVSKLRFLQVDHGGASNTHDRAGSAAFRRTVETRGVPEDDTEATIHKKDNTT